MGVPEVGDPGGDLRMLVGRARETRLYPVYGYARLVGRTPDLRLVPDILASYEVEEGRIFTFHLRKGHRWSDGQPFTAEDFRFWWEDVALDKDLSPTGPDSPWSSTASRPGSSSRTGYGPLRLVEAQPLLPAGALRRDRLFIYRPAHYLRQFHERYADPTSSRPWSSGPGRATGCSSSSARTG